VRFVMLLLLTLFFGGWALGQIPRGSAPPPEVSPWRRTAAGWENSEEWMPSASPPHRLSPFLLGALQVGISLVALTAAREKRSPAVANDRPV